MMAARGLPCRLFKKYEKIYYFNLYVYYTSLLGVMRP